MNNLHIYTISYIMIDYSKKAKINNIKYSFISFCNQNKLALFFSFLLIIIFLLTGIFTGIKLYNLNSSINFNDYSFITLVSGDIYSVTIFIKRFLSVILVLGLCILFSINKWLRPLGYCLICYRAFLISLNCTFIVIFLGIGGAINSILIIFPCQIALLTIILFCFITSISAFKIKSLCGKLNNNMLNHILFSIIIVFIINILEALLLVTFKSTTLLII